MKTRPYIIVTPTYCVSAGVRVMHSLCHELNSLGLDARLLLTTDLSRGSGQYLNPAFNTPVTHTQNPEWEALKDEAIVIYTDGIQGNPLGAKRVVRYVLGKEMPKPTDDPSDFRIYYSRAFPVQRQAKHPTLFLFPVDLGLFNDKGVVTRDQDMRWLGKGAKYCVNPEPNVVDVTYSWPATREDLAANFRRTRYLYSYDGLSCTNQEAILCGAIVIVKHLSYHDWEWTRADLAAMEHGIGGYAFGDSDFEIDRARRTRMEMVESLRYHVATFRQKLLDFVDESQQRFIA
ncbi:MAG TPA: hypothetical protein VGM81_05255 [Burkholderiaceae bacterium]|jgi:hypothetical protein